MAKSTKHQENVPQFDAFRAPWETETGAEAEIDKAKLKRYIHGLVVDKAKAQDAREDAQAEVEALTTERDDLKARADSGDGAEATKQIEKLTRERDALKAERDELVSANEERELRATVLAGLPEKYAKRVTGKTEADLKASLKELAEDFDIPLTKDGLYDAEAASGGDEDEDDLDGRVRPQTSVRRFVVNPSDEEGGDGGPIDFDKAVDQILAGRRGPL